MATSNKIELLTLSSDIEEWFERFEFFIIAQNLKQTVAENANEDQIQEARLKNLATFISKVDGGVYKLIKSLCRPDNVETFEYDEVKRRLMEHLAPKPTKFAQRYKFHKLVQREGQTASDFIAELKSVGAKCEYRDFSEALLDRLLVGLRDEKLVCELLVKENLTLDDAVKEVLGREQASKEAQLMNCKVEKGAVNKVSLKRNSAHQSVRSNEGRSSKQKNRTVSSSRNKVKCSRCKLLGHSGDQCKTKCFECGQLYHVRNQCWKNTGRSSRCNNVVEEENNSEEEEYNLANFDNLLPEEMFCVQDESANQWFSLSECASNEMHESFNNMFDSNSLFDFNADNLHEIWHAACADKCLKHLWIDSNGSEKECSDSTTTVELIPRSRVCSQSDLPSSVVDDWFSSDTNLEEATCKLSSSSKPILTCLINGRPLAFEFDTGSSLTVVSHGALEEAGFKLNLTPTRRTLVVANGVNQPIKGYATVEVEFNKKKVSDLHLYVVDGYFPALFGRSWIECFCGTDWLTKLVGNSRDVEDRGEVDLQTSYPGNRSAICHAVKKVSVPQKKESERVVREVPVVSLNTSPIRSFEELTNSVVFKPGLGTVKDYEARLVLQDSVKPVMMKARHLPYAMKKKVEDKLLSMEADGILEKIDDSPWGTPIVPVKKGEDVRLCGDYKSTLNKCLSTRQYPIPTIEECFNSVTGSTRFSVVDIKQAYNNLVIRKEDRILTTLSTHLGLYQWCRLPYGISSSAAIFQGVMDSTIQGIPLTCCRIDDILIGGKTEEEHMKLLNRVIEAIEKRGMKCKLEKSQFNKSEVTYLGHKVSADGIRPVKEKVDALRNSPVPQNVDELVSFLGAVNYYRRYLPNLATVIAPLDKLRQKDTKWQWTEVEQQSYEKLKQMLCSRQVLALYDPSLPLKLDTDASSVGIGAVLSHELPNGEEKPIEFISRTLTPTERRYSQIEREALAIVWAVKRFHIYLYGQKFNMVTDHKALTFIFAKNKGIPEMSASRITRWAIFLMNYDFEIKYRNTKDHGNADMLSRLPKSGNPREEADDECTEIFAVSMNEVLLDARVVASKTKRDVTLAKVMSYILEGWPDEMPAEEGMRPYWQRRLELSVELGCVTWGTRVVIPVQLQDWILEMLHSAHIGMVGMKSLARSYVWFPGIDAKIEETVRRCPSCIKYGKSLPKLEDHPWAKPSGPFQRVHIDFGEYQGLMWLILQCAYSKWPEVIRMNRNTTTAATIRALRFIFVRTGLPMTLVSDNGPQLVSEEMETFLTRNGITHITVPTYSPKSNGLCERLVGTFKDSMKKMSLTCSDVDKNVANFLLTYRNTPHSTTGQPPAVLAFNRTLRFNLHQLKPTDRKKREELQSEKEQRVIDSRRGRSFESGDTVYVQVDNDKTWQEAKVRKRYDHQSDVYDLECNGRVIKKHADKIKRADPVMSKTPDSVMLKTPETVMLKTPDPVMSKTPNSVMLKTPDPVMLKTPDQVMLKTPNPVMLEKTEMRNETAQTPRVVSENRDTMVSVGSSVNSSSRPVRQAKLEAVGKIREWTSNSKT